MILRILVGVGLLSLLLPAPRVYGSSPCADLLTRVQTTRELELNLQNPVMGALLPQEGLIAMAGSEVPVAPWKTKPGSPPEAGAIYRRITELLGRGVEWESIRRLAREMVETRTRSDNSRRDGARSTLPLLLTVRLPSVGIDALDGATEIVQGDTHTRSFKPDGIVFTWANSESPTKATSAKAAPAFSAEQFDVVLRPVTAGAKTATLAVTDRATGRQVLAKTLKGIDLSFAAQVIVFRDRNTGGATSEPFVVLRGSTQPNTFFLVNFHGEMTRLQVPSVDGGQIHFVGNQSNIVVPLFGDSPGRQLFRLTSEDQIVAIQPGRQFKMHLSTHSRHMVITNNDGHIVDPATGENTFRLPIAYDEPLPVVQVTQMSSEMDALVFVKHNRTENLFGIQRFNSFSFQNVGAPIWIRGFPTDLPPGLLAGIRPYQLPDGQSGFVISIGTKTFLIPESRLTAPNPEGTLIDAPAPVYSLDADTEQISTIHWTNEFGPLLALEVFHSGIEDIRVVRLQTGETLAEIRDLPFRPGHHLNPRVSEGPDRRIILSWMEERGIQFAQIFGPPPETR